MGKTFSTHSAEETRKLAEVLLPTILNKRIIQLKGSLGSGKTTFVQGLGDALKVKERITSPTYAYLHRFKIGIKSPYEHLLHFDLYRLEKVEDSERTASELGLIEALEDPRSLVIIEWPEHLEKALSPYSALSLCFRSANTFHTISVC